MINVVYSRTLKRWIWIDPTHNAWITDENGNLRKDITNDGLHLLGQGYLIWRDVLDPYIKE